ncbi:uncharacterized protein [Ptychodera flava]|uniref:uncharacterized protein isoform X1 n=2 Tax=Ptychodera flava TaxID=63121 RepID=UPI003969F31E
MMTSRQICCAFGRWSWMVDEVLSREVVVWQLFNRKAGNMPRRSETTVAAIQANTNTKGVLTVQVAKPLTVSKYQIGDKEKTAGRTVVCDNTAPIICYVEDPPKFSSFHESKVIMIKKYSTRLQDGNLIVSVGKNTEVFDVNKVLEIPEALLTAAQVLDVPVAPAVNITEARTSPRKRKLTVEGKVIKVSDVQTVGHKNIPLKKFHLQDATGDVSVALWRDQSKLSVAVDDCISVSCLQVGEYRKEPVLSSTDFTMIKPVPKENLKIFLPLMFLMMRLCRLEPLLVSLKQSCTHLALTKDVEIKPWMKITPV